MQILDSFSQNSIMSVPWMLDAEAEDLDLEIHGCGCGCGSCGCACTCSCSCSCSCDDTGAHEDDNEYSGDFSASDDSGDEGAGPSAADIGQCATDIVSKGISDGLTAAIGASATGANLLQVATAFVAGTASGTAQALTQSEACAQVASDVGANVVETYNELVNDESFTKASETLLVVH